MYIERDITANFKKNSQIYNMIAIVGVRQSGKTTFLKHMLHGKNSSFVMFDDPDTREIFNSDIKKFWLQYMKGFDVVGMDEIQYCKNTGPKLKYLVDSGEQMWITSSSEIILAKETLSYLVGRISILRLYPFSIFEFLRSKNEKVITPKMLERFVWEHFTYGGYPGVVTIDDFLLKRTILENLVETMILKDIAKIFSIEKIANLEKFLDYLAAINGGIISYNKISADLSISYRTIKKYLDAFSKSYLIREIKPYYKNAKKEITKQPKIYFVDTGIRNLISQKFNPKPDGLLFENYVLTEILKMGFIPKYWRTKSKTEVDFIVEKDGKVIPIEVKLNNDKMKIPKSMRTFARTYHPEFAVIVMYNFNKNNLKNQTDIPDKPISAVSEKANPTNYPDFTGDHIIFRETRECDFYFSDIIGLWEILTRRKSVNSVL